MMEEEGNTDWLEERERREAEAMAAEAKRRRKNELLAKVGREPVVKAAVEFDAVYGGLEELAAPEDEGAEGAGDEKEPEELPDVYKLAVVAAVKKAQKRKREKLTAEEVQVLVRKTLAEKAQPEQIDQFLAVTVAAGEDGKVDFKEFEKNVGVEKK